MDSLDQELDRALTQFGLSSFRPGQREVISAIVAGHDCMCVMPTGGGKSLCFQLPAVIRPGLTIVVSPLIALMKDQVDALGKKGIPAALINSTLSLGEQTQRLQDVAAGKYKLVYVAPERLRSHRFLEAIRATPIQLLAIDEAHCISQWGHDFRPDYARLGRFREWLGDIQTVALTATATPRVREDIVEVLRLRRPKQFMSGFARPNLDFGVVQRQSDREKEEQLEQFLKREPGAGIVYAATRKRCDSLVELIQQKLRIPVGAYHAGMPPDQRRAIQERFMKNELRIIVATNAFGMGIDKPDLRFVVHFNIPGSLEAYYQEAGRAGRDGQQSQCVLLYSFQDRYIQEFFIDNNYPPRDVIEAVYEFMSQRKEDPIELTLDEIRDGMGLSISTEAIGSSLTIIARTGVIERLETGGGLAKLRIDSDLPTLVDMLSKESDVKRKVMRAVERIVGSRRGEDVYVHPRWLLQELQMDREVVNRHLRELATRLNVFDYVPPFRGRATHFVQRDVPFDQLQIDFVALGKRKEAEYERLNQVVRYAQTPRCRQATILDYFGDAGAADCGHCDRCLGATGWPHLAQRMRGLPAATQAPAMPIEEISSSNQDVDWVPKTDAQLEKEGQVKPPTGRDKPAQRRSDLTSATKPAATRSADETPESTGSEQPLQNVPAELNQLLVEVLAAIDRTHGRLGKILICQFLCGSNNAKVQKLRLHRLSGFGMLTNFRQGDAQELVDAFLAVGLLQQQEVNRHRPTVSLSVDVSNGLVNRRQIIERMQLSAGLIKRLQAVIKGTAGALAAASPIAASAGGSVLRADSPAESSLADRAEPLRGESPRAAVPKVDPVGLGQLTTAAVPRAEADDWSWTWQLLVDGYDWLEVMSIRRKTDLELATDLQQALRQSKTVQRQWLVPPAGAAVDAQPTTGQQRILRELQRRSAAGV